jgi:hypothetical protein
MPFEGGDASELLRRIADLTAAGIQVIAPLASPIHAPAVVELTVLAALTGALDLADHQAQVFIVRTLARTDPERRAAYTGLILDAASEPEQRELEKLMRTARRGDNLADRLLAEGRAEGRAATLLLILETPGFTVFGIIELRLGYLGPATRHFQRAQAPCVHRHHAVLTGQVLMR